MDPNIWLLVAAVVLPVSYLGWCVVSVDRTADRLIRTRLVAIANYRPAEVSQVKRGRLIRLARHLTPRAYVNHLDLLLGKAGRPASMPLDRVLTLKPTAALGGAMVGLILGGLSSPQGALLAICITAACYFLPDLLIYNASTKRQAQIAVDLPNVMDQLLISVEAGLGFEVAMARVGANGKGPLAEEMVRTLQDIQAGRTRREAYKAMAARSTAPDLRSFVGAIVQADAQGLSIARVLKPQADQMRIKRRLRAEEKAMKLPVAVVFPLLLFIFPPLFIVILGPAAINIVNTFSN